MLKENSRKWQSDDRKVMNWDYHEKDDYFINPQNVRFNFNAYRRRTDKYGFTRDFKEYIAEKYDENHQLIAAALTPKGYLKRISVNENWEYFKSKQRELLSAPETGQIYAQRKIDVEPVFWQDEGFFTFQSILGARFRQGHQGSRNRNTGVKHYETGHGRDQL
ncbi:hypothetical protein LAP9435_3254 [Lactiplantibacillus plantarum]|nr:hypothetical protein LAP9434_03261 [Lactiplantibacillus plantarum]VFQ58215.1 hypothetical protein LAP9435_3254 [Lactiplantibacillus plantarum]